MDVIRQFMELVYFATGPILAIFAGWGLRQITVARDAAKLSAKRESFRLAAEQCNRFMEQLIPRINVFDTLNEKAPLGFLKSTMIEIKEEGFIFKPGKLDREDEADVTVFTKGLDIVNSLESFAVFFTTEVAAEGVAYPVVGKTYCQVVERLLPIVAIGASDSRYKELLTLFFLWRNRLAKDQLLMEKARLEARLQGLPGKTITPMGLES